VQLVEERTSGGVWQFPPFVSQPFLELVIVTNGQRSLAECTPRAHNASMGLLRHGLDLNEPKPQL
jgi:hypothetical protein